MPILHIDIAVLAIVQGVTEFLPISSQAHLRLVSAVTGWADQGLIMDVAVHVGTLGAVMLYFWRDIGAMTVGLLRLMRGRGDPGVRLAGLLIVSTIPALAAKGDIGMTEAYRDGCQSAAERAEVEALLRKLSQQLN